MQAEMPADETDDQRRAREMPPDDRADELLHEIREILAFRARVQRAYDSRRDDIDFSLGLIELLEVGEGQNNFNDFQQFYAACQATIPGNDDEEDADEDLQLAISAVVRPEFAAMTGDRETFDRLHIPE
jgi:hypothetical protein